MKAFRTRVAAWLRRAVPDSMHTDAELHAIIEPCHGNSRRAERKVKSGFMLRRHFATAPFGSKRPRVDREMRWR
jgi:hypothetical protein